MAIKASRVNTAGETQAIRSGPILPSLHLQHWRVQKALHLIPQTRYTCVCGEVAEWLKALPC